MMAADTNSDAHSTEKQTNPTLIRFNMTLQLCYHIFSVKALFFFAFSKRAALS